jgi:ABC-type multidrug transport system permease subunit
MLLPSPFRAEVGDFTVAFFSIGCFVIIFVIAIFWATRPARKGGSRYH